MPTSRLARGIADLFPGYFSLVMATGVVSIASQLLGLRLVARGLLLVNVVAYGALALMLLARLARHFDRVLKDLGDHSRGPGFFTVVAGTCVLGSELVLIEGAANVAFGLWIAGIALWVLVMYSFFTATAIREPKPTLQTGINGAWLIAAVATQSVATLGALLGPGLAENREPVLFFALCMWLLGASLYLTIITLIFYRFTFLSLTRESLTPPYWINMGAVAITTLTGSTLMLAADSWPLLVTLRPFLAGFTLFFWSAGTWWIPLLLILGVWRHFVQRFPLRYDPQYWGMVFPLGMYTAGTARMSVALDLPFLMPIPRLFLIAALVAWATVFVGMCRSLLTARD